MPRRIEIELTSARPDGTWTWRAAGAQKPKGVVDGSILPANATVGDVLRVEAEQEIDGLSILSVVAGREKAERGGLLELLPSSDFEPVTQVRAERARGDRDDRRGGRDRDRPRSDRDRPPRRDRPEGDTTRGDRDRRGPRRDSPGGEPSGRPPRSRPPRPHFTPPPELPQRPKPKRLRPGRARRSEVLSSIPEEQRSIAELALQGMAAVRQKVRDENARAKAEGRAEMPEASVLKIAEDLLPRLRVAEWLDRAEAAQSQLDDLDLRDLRSVVAGADDPAVARDESTRELAATLKAALLTKQEQELALWLGDIDAALGIGRVVRALRLSSQPPKAGVPFPAEMAARLAGAATASLAATDPPDRWAAVLEAVAFSPVRTHVTPTAPPEQRSDELTATATRLAPLLPQIAQLLGIEVPAHAPPPKPLRPTSRPSKYGAKPAAKPSGATPRPPKPAPPVAEPPAAPAGAPTATARAPDQPRDEPTATTVDQPTTAPPTEPAAPDEPTATTVDQPTTAPPTEPGDPPANAPEREPEPVREQGADAAPTDTAT
jgi:hypothetical protein